MKSLKQLIGEAIGQASTCWTNLKGAGEFDSTAAIEIAQQLESDIRTHQYVESRSPNIVIKSLPTTEEINGLKVPVIVFKVLLEGVKVLIEVKTYISVDVLTFTPQRKTVIIYNIENIQDARTQYGKDLAFQLREAVYNVLFDSVENATLTRQQPRTY